MQEQAQGMCSGPGQTSSAGMPCMHKSEDQVCSKGQVGREATEGRESGTSRSATCSSASRERGSESEGSKADSGNSTGRAF